MFSGGECGLKTSLQGMNLSSCFVSGNILKSTLVHRIFTPQPEDKKQTRSLGFHVFSTPRHIGDRGRRSFRRSPLVEVGVGARSCADNTLCRVGRAWRGRVALRRAVPKWGILKSA